ncbi:hypothetical protein BJ508DRAFT_314191 [Ascobolus immersus RN42]|uniref:F-box domain-containing protein n=1 Tax=Ascobolus immersus RN42 TaxID=1160509 RepID=A0A3N4HLS7_ASCIM|nr:hypothetical protein BJ508DRAFT_314191 [Ascobolus immersus RN42]
MPLKQTPNAKVSIMDLPNELLHDMILYSTTLRTFHSLSRVNRRFNLLTSNAAKDLPGALFSNILNRGSGRANVVEFIFSFLRDACDQLIRFDRQPGYEQLYTQNLSNSAALLPGSLTSYHYGDWSATMHRFTSRLLHGTIFGPQSKRLTIIINGGYVRLQKAELDPQWLRTYYELRVRKWGAPEFEEVGPGMEHAFLLGRLVEFWEKPRRGVWPQLVDRVDCDVRAKGFCREVEVRAEGYLLVQGRILGPLGAS